MLVFLCIVLISILTSLGLIRFALYSYICSSSLSISLYYIDAHFACSEPGCVEMKHVVFKSLFELRNHINTTHGSGKNDAQSTGVAEISDWSQLAGKPQNAMGAFGGLEGTSTTTDIGAGAQNSNGALSGLSSTGSDSLGGISGGLFGIQGSNSGSSGLDALVDPFAPVSTNINNTNNSGLFGGLLGDNNGNNQSSTNNRYATDPFKNDQDMRLDLDIGSLLNGFDMYGDDSNDSKNISRLDALSGGNDSFGQTTSGLGGLGSLGGLGDNMANSTSGMNSTGFGNSLFDNLDGTVGSLSLGDLDNDNSTFGFATGGFGKGGVSAGPPGIDTLNHDDSNIFSLSGLSRANSDGSRSFGLGGSSVGDKDDDQSSISTSGGIDVRVPVHDLPHDQFHDLDEITAHNAAIIRSTFAPEFIDRLIAVLKESEPHGILGSAFPEAYRRIWHQRLVLETKRGRKIKLLSVLEGHPNFYKSGARVGGLRLHYRETDAPIPAHADKEYTPADLEIQSEKSLGENDPDLQQGSTGDADPGLEVDLLGPEAFPSMSWLAQHNMHMYRWAGNEVEWTEYALRCRPDVVRYLLSPSQEVGGHASILDSIRNMSGCRLSFQSEKLRGEKEKFLVFVRGSSGSVDNTAMTAALELVSQSLHEHFSTIGNDKISNDIF